MLNVNQRLDGNKLILEIDLAQSHGPSIPGAGFTLNVWKK
jgi:hypothetical protein